jgi:hypothetical protein
VIPDSHIFNWFTIHDVRVHSVDGSYKQLPRDYQKPKDTKLWVEAKQPFEMFCQDVWKEAQQHDRGMRTFLDMVAARIPADLARNLAPLLKMEGSYTDENTKYRVADLGTITPVEWIRLATPIVLHAGIPMIRRQMAQSLTQGESTTFLSFITGLERTFMVAGIHYGWHLQIVKEKILERFPQALNKKLHDSYLKKFGSAYIAPDRYEEVIAHLKQVDGWRNVEHRNFGGDNNPFHTMIIEADAANQTQRKQKVQPEKGESSSDAHKRDQKRQQANDQTSMGSSKKSILKENRTLQARIRQLESQQNPSASTTETSSVNVVLTSCNFCRRKHPWPVEECYRNPNCSIPKDQRIPGKLNNQNQTGRKPDDKNKGKSPASK